MKINIFKGTDYFSKLEKYGLDLIEAWETYGDYDGVKSDWWFNPKKVKKLECVVMNQPKETQLRQLNQLDYDALLYRLLMYPPNYLTLFLINLFYPNKKDILIEDACAGMGRLIFYLSKCGYTNFSIIEDFSQVTKFLMEGVLITAGIKYILNDFTTKPTVVNTVGYPVYSKNNIPDSVELFCSYGNEAILSQIKKLFDKAKDDYIELCTDHNIITKVFCRRDKYDEFYRKIKPLEFKEGK